MDHLTIPPGYESHRGVHLLCHRCGWRFPNARPSPKKRRSHKKRCGTIEGSTNLTQAVSDDKEKTPSTNDDVVVESNNFNASPEVSEKQDGNIKKSGPTEVVVSDSTELTDKYACDEVVLESIYVSQSQEVISTEFVEAGEGKSQTLEASAQKAKYSDTSKTTPEINEPETLESIEGISEVFEHQKVESDDVVVTPQEIYDEYETFSYEEEVGDELKHEEAEPGHKHAHLEAAKVDAEKSSTNDNLGFPVSSAATSVHKLFECPVCKSFMHSPIFQCRDGHTLCSTCKKEARDQCPTCSLKLGEIRCLSLEKIAALSEYRCRFNSSGCPELLQYYNKVDHEKLCKFSTQRDPCSGSEDYSTDNIGLNLAKSVRDLLECHVCVQPMYPPIYQCLNGHTLCSKCKSQLGKCPTCKMEIWAQCLALERVADTLEVPCSFIFDGCPVISTYYRIVEHEEALCYFRPYKCPHVGSHCGYTGEIPFLVEHLRDYHKVDMHTGSTFNHRYVKSNPLKVVDGTWMLTLFNCFGQHFCLHFEAFQLETTPVYMAFLEFMGKAADARNYRYSLEFGDDEGKVIWEGTPRSIKDGHGEARDSYDGLIITRDMALFFSGGDMKELKLRVTGKIWKEQQNQEDGVSGTL